MASSHMMNSKDLQELRALPGNTRCIDCDRSKPEWASVTFGIFMCLECSGPHRSLGTHISFVRSIKMDSWTDSQIKRMKISGGNTACREFLSSSQGIQISTSFRISKTTFTSIQNKYRTPQGQLYQQILDARMEGKPEPTELPKVDNVQDDDDKQNNNNEDGKKEYNAIRSPSNNNSSNSQVGGAVKIMEGFGSDPHPSEKLGSEKPKRGDRRRKIMLGKNNDWDCDNDAL
ncbi:ArfGap-domain-containing protein [Fragilariopsis cylindrus CCMP1102]|uniref:ArfGap-domain-containing protein n=1 Tax=Fragilariopsis cylindrus CCMP1102 TaxID=635003 RepID=A0A1E7FM31_9STRA|nr:ArfGap-domain-containing protein [Fragilariopsis cylindrus CCMP1102]|eukprot:OEU19184.1 ArfGap-domain-containing protein [Fragilariopsis cylindrus CCMP1102]